MSGYKFRKYLHIKTKDSKLTRPDLLVVMMNPGSSRPLDGNNDGRSEVSTAPDRTQHQIMSFMNLAGFCYARILNLSDKREAKSISFFQFLNSRESQSIPHSIFDKSRREDLDTLLIENTPVLCAWGVDPCLSKLARSATNILPPNSIFGSKKPLSEYAYYHPLPRSSERQKKWIDDVYQSTR